MKTIVVINTKGGVGKTTLAINLASYFATNNVRTTIMDYDPQGSSLNWLQKRPTMAPRIHASNAAPPTSGLRSLRRYVPPDTRQLIVDAPAGASRLLQQDMLCNADHIVIPVAPSTIDIHVTANFIKDLLLAGRIRTHGIKVGVVANRVRNSIAVYAPLERFLHSLNVPFVARLRDSEVYLEAAASGCGIFEMNEAVSARERQEFMPIVEWIGSGRGTSASTNIVALTSTRR